VHYPVKIDRKLIEFDLFGKDNPTGEDGEGWYYFGKRYYDADVGRWIACDPQGQHHDAYLYGSDNPINRIDF
jgi:RHS repeat-associated protein